MSNSDNAIRHRLDLTWVPSMGGPLIVLPVSALHQWGGCTEDGVMVGGTDQLDDYDRACAVEEHAEVISLGDTRTASVLVLGDEPATTCYLAEQRIFLRWLAADSGPELLAAAEAVLSDPATPWEKCGVWETDGPAVLMDSAEAGEDLGVPYPDGRGKPAEAPVPVPAGRWEVRAFHKTGDFPGVGIVQLLAADDGDQPDLYMEGGESEGGG
ncbi:Imm21 family immunity protein [Streptomyces sp. NPDC002138]|uniref:Imm21 family immunity protein n=1 Tax=Streptomyces sp. NPDC002138 TaxID=3154410 RepID=UPI003332C0C6